MIHTLYSNSYRVLRELLASNVRGQIQASLAQNASTDDVGCFFDQAVVATGSAGVAEDLSRFFAKDKTLSSWVDVKRLSTWQGDQVYGSYLAAGHMDAVWVIYGILTDTAFVNQFDRLRQYLVKTNAQGATFTKSESEIFALASRIYTLFTMYFTHRPDWLFSWLMSDNAQTLPALQTREWAAFKRALDKAIGKDRESFFSFDRYAYKEEKSTQGHQRALSDLAWQEALFIELCRRHPTWAGLKVFTQFRSKYEALLETLQTITTDTHVVLPFELPPNFLTTFRALAGMPRKNALGEVDPSLPTPNLWFYVLNPSGDFWFDWAFSHKATTNGSTATDPLTTDANPRAGNPLLLGCGKSTRAVIDRLWRFTAADLATDDFLFEERNDVSLDREATQRLSTFEKEAAVDTFQYVPPRLESVPFERDEVSLWGVPPENGTFLQGLQRAVFKNTQTLEWGAMPLNADGTRQDQTFSLLKAPTPTREVDAVMDAIVALLNDKKARSQSPLGTQETGPYRPEDIVVLTPNLDEKTSLIKRALFTLEGQGRGIPARIVGESLMDVDAMSQAVIAVLRFVLGRAEKADFKALLGLSAVRAALRLDEDDVNVAGGWLDAAGYRYGLSDEHLSHLNSTAFAHDNGMSLMRTLERLLLSRLLPDGSFATLDDVIPMSGEVFGAWTTAADRPELLNTLLAFAEALDDLRKASLDRQTLATWHSVVGDVIDTLLTPQEGRAPYSSETVLKILGRVCLDGVMGEGSASASMGTLPSLEVPLSLVADGLERLLKTETKPLMRTDAVTFADMKALRGVASPVVIIFGLDEESHFPGITRVDEFDLIGQFPRRGDRDRRQDNANLFMDAVLSAERELILSYVSGTGSAQKDPCSLVVSLTDWLDHELETSNTEHLMPYRFSVPLSVKDERNFLASQERFQSHNHPLCEALVTNAQAPVPVFGNAGLQLSRTVPVTDLADFVKKPERFALKTLGLRAEGVEDEAERFSVVDNGALSRSQRLKAGWVSTDTQHLSAQSSQWEHDPTLGVAALRQPMAEALEGAIARMDAHVSKAHSGYVPVGPTAFWVEFDKTGPIRAGWGEPTTGGKAPDALFASVNDVGDLEADFGTLVVTGTLNGWGMAGDSSGIPQYLHEVNTGKKKVENALKLIGCFGLVQCAVKLGLSDLGSLNATFTSFDEDKKLAGDECLSLKKVNAWNPVDSRILPQEAEAALIKTVIHYLKSGTGSPQTGDDTTLTLLSTSSHSTPLDAGAALWQRGLTRDEVSRKVDALKDLTQVFEEALS